MNALKKIIHSLEPLTDYQVKLIRQKTGAEVCFIQRESYENQIEKLADIEYLICRDRDSLSKMLNFCPKLKLIYVLSAGVERLPFDMLRRRNIIVCNASGINAEVMSQFAMAQILSHSAKVRENLSNQQKHHWKKYQCMEDLRKRRLLIAGAGRSGTLLAHKAKAFQMEVVGANFIVKNIFPFDRIVSLKDFDSMIDSADYIVCALPLTEYTERYFKYDVFSRMKTTACFINMSRGKLVETKGLVRALKEKKLSCAILDVFDEEPIESNNKLWDIPNLYITPHMAGRTSNFMDEAITLFCDNFMAHIQGLTEPTKIDLINGF